jgi:hypothetical protein
MLAALMLAIVIFSNGVVLWALALKMVEAPRGILFGFVFGGQLATIGVVIPHFYKMMVAAN